MRVLFIGTGDIGLPALRWLLREHEVVAVIAQPDKPVGRKQELTPPPTKRLALEHGVPVLQLPLVPALKIASTSAGERARL